MTDVVTPDPLPPENIYGHRGRLEWIAARLPRDGSAVEIGCGTGLMVTAPLARLGFRVRGCDLDGESIAYGRRYLMATGGDPELVVCGESACLGNGHAAVIATEVLEHIPDDQLAGFLTAARARLRPDGTLLVTVPNGYGWFEIESAVFTRIRFLARWFRRLGLAGRIVRGKEAVLGQGLTPDFVSTLSASPHVQRFSYHSIRRLLDAHGFTMNECRGSVLVAGPISSLLFTGLRPVMRLNARLGQLLPWFASGFYLACRLRSESPKSG